MRAGTYIAGPMRGIPEFNFPAFFAAEAAIVDLYDGPVLNPAQRDVDAGFDPTGLTGSDVELAAVGFDLAEAMRHDIGFIATIAERLILLPGWSRSSGACCELEVARKCGLDVLFIHDDSHRIYEWPGPLDSGRPVVGEVRTTSSTGGEKGTKPERFDLVPVEPQRITARVYAFGAEKYEDDNWRKGYEWSKSYAAAMRHLTAFWGGEDLDPESGLPHLGHAVFHMNSLMEWATTHPEFDDRWRADGSATG